MLFARLFVRPAEVYDYKPDQVLGADSRRTYAASQDGRAGNEDTPAKSSSLGEQRGGVGWGSPSCTENAEADTQADSRCGPREWTRLLEEPSDIEGFARAYEFALSSASEYHTNREEMHR
jgi:hypothetical protein